MFNETTEQFEYKGTPGRGRTAAVITGFVLLAAANFYLLTKVNRVEVSANTFQTGVKSEVAKAQESAALTSGKTRRDLEALRNEIEAALEETTKAAKAQARNETAWLARNVSRQQREQQEQLLGELRSVDGKTVQTLQRVDDVSTDVDAVKDEVGEARAQLERTNSTLGQTVEHMGAMNEQIAGHQESIASLRRLSERNRIAFDLSKSKEMLKVGDIQLRLRAADGKRNKYTLEVLADDATVVKKEKNLNEPVQFYISGSSQPYEIVITGISKDRVTGYLATPKAKTARG